MTQLKFRDIWGNHITDISPLKELTELEKLCMGNSRITELSRFYTSKACAGWVRIFTV